MRKHVLLSLIMGLCAMSAWGTDVSLTEKFSEIEQIAAVASDTWGADICTWSTAYARHRSGATYIDPSKVDPQTNEDIITVNSSPMYSVWMSAAADNKRGCIQTTNWEGGIKAVSFRWAQFGAESSNRLALEVKAGSIVDDSTTNVNLKKVSGGVNKTTGGIEYTHTFECKSNGQLSIKNISKKGGGNACRILIGHITITPYILYRPHNKHITLGLKQKGFKNFLIDNTEDEGTITYSSCNTSIATVDAYGVITPKSAGTTTITASWESCSTTYSLTIIGGEGDDVVVENFSKIGLKESQLSTEETWEGDFGLSWKTKIVRRNWADTLVGVSPRTLGTLFPRTADAEAYFDASNIEGGVKHLYFRAIESGACSDYIETRAYYAATGSALGTAVATYKQTTVGDGVVYEFDKPISENGEKGNGHLRFKNTSNASATDLACIVIPNIQITPWLLYTTKEATLNMRVESPDPTRTFTNEALINNIEDGSITYSIIENLSNISVGINSDGQVTATNKFQTGDITVQASWSEVTTTYTLHVLGKTETTASYAISSKKIDLNGDATNNITKPEDYDGTISYASSNTDVVQVVNNELRVVGVGVTTITATLPETELFSGTSASYTLYVRDANARKEQFSIVTANGVVGTTLTQWAGDLFEWQAQYQVRRKEGDNINEGTETPHLGTSIGIEDYSTTPKSSFLQSKATVEGGIKHMSFYWAQWGAHKNCTRRIAVYAGEDLIGVGEHKNGVQGDEFLIGINHQVKSNEQLIFKNESYMGETYETKTSLSTADNSSRIVIGAIEITPYLFYSDKAHTMRLGDAPYIHPLINNTGGNNISYSLVPANSAVASINSSTGEVTALKAGEVTIKENWDDEGAGAYTTYHLSIKPKQTASTKVETFPNATDYTYKVGGVENNIQQSQCKWIVREAGFNSNENFEANVAFIRQKYDGQTKQSYIQTDENISGGINTLSFDWNIVGNEPDVTEWDIIAQIKQDDEVKKEIHLLSSAGGVLENVHKRNNGWRSTVLTDIDVTGDFIIRFENHSTINGTYTSGNKARFVIDNVEWKAANDIALADEDDNTEIIRDNDGKVADVQLTDRTIRTGGYNTLCLPFDVSEEKLKAVLGEEVKAYEFTNAYLSESSLDIRFDKVTELEAGKPYLVTVPADVTNPVFESVTIDASSESEDINIINGDNMRFIGSFNSGTMSNTGLYVVADKLYRVEIAANKTIGACRAYFDVLPGAQAVPRNVRMRIVAGKETTTGLEEAGRETVNTVRSEKKIIDGQLIIIREGKMYNAQGQVIR